MAAVWVRLRVELRSGWRRWLALAVLLGFGGGATIAAAAGARRTETAYPRFVASSKALDLITGGGPDGFPFERAEAEMSSLPIVEQSVRVGTGFALEVRGTVVFPPAIVASYYLDPAYGRTFDIPKVLAGRLAAPDRPNEATLARPAAIRYGLRPGDHVTVLLGDPDHPTRRVVVLITGIVVTADDFEGVGIQTFPSLLMTPAFAHAYHDDLGMPPDSLGVRLRHGQRDIPAFVHEMQARGFGSWDVVIVRSSVTHGVQRSMRFIATAMWALAAFFGASVLAVGGQALSRLASSEVADQTTLRSLGMTPWQLWLGGMIRASIVGVVAAGASIVVAYAASPLSPIGAARIAEPHPGAAFDATALGVGAAAVALAALALSALPSWRAARAYGARTMTSASATSLAGVLARGGGSVTSVTGTRLAFEPGRGGARVPVRQAILGVALGIMALVVAFVAASSLTKLLDDPVLSGTTWDAGLGGSSKDVDAILRADPNVAAFSRGTVANAIVGGVPLFAMVMDSGGPVGPQIVAGREPRDVPDGGIVEVAVGGTTMRRMHLRIGSVVQITGGEEDSPGARFPARVVGRVVVPQFPYAIVEPGEGIAITTATLRRYSDQNDPNQQPGAFIRYKRGVDGRAETDKLDAELGNGSDQPLVPTPRSDLADIGRLADTPLVLAGVMALMAAGILVQTLVSSVRRRRRDLAILKTLGFSRRQIWSTVAWQASAMTFAALLVGIPVGIIAGRIAWNAFADRLGVVPSPALPLTALAITVVASILVSNLAASMPGIAAARTKAAAVLRSE